MAEGSRRAVLHTAGVLYKIFQFYGIVNFFFFKELELIV